MAKKASMLSKVREEKASAGSTGKVRFSPVVTEVKEKEELRKTIRRLEERLRDGDAEDVLVQDFREPRTHASWFS